MNQTLDLAGHCVDIASLADVCRRYSVRELSLFGSAARGEMRPESDVDFMVEFKPGARVGRSSSNSSRKSWNASPVGPLI